MNCFVGDEGILPWRNLGASSGGMKSCFHRGSWRDLLSWSHHLMFGYGEDLLSWVDKLQETMHTLRPYEVRQVRRPDSLRVFFDKLVSWWILLVIGLHIEGWRVALKTTFVLGSSCSSSSRKTGTTLGSCLLGSFVLWLGGVFRQNEQGRKVKES